MQGSQCYRLIGSFILLVSTIVTECYDWEGLRLFEEHVPMVLRNNVDLQRECRKDDGCPYKNIFGNESCWGYEENCERPYVKNFTTCNSQKELEKYWTQGDFGKVRRRLDELKSRKICKPSHATGSSLTCTQDATMCRAKNLFLQIPHFNQKHDNVIEVPHDGVIGGFCNLDRKQLEKETVVKRSLSTWGIQLHAYQSLKFNPFDDVSKHCDVILDKPVVFVQLDAVGNLYHHFCDFFNLYLTQHTNNSWFGSDVQVIRWSAHPRFRDPFMDAWKVFTDHEVLSLHEYAYKKVCIPDATFSFLPRMAGGLYYSTWLEPGCRGSKLVKSFGDHLLHRLNVTSDRDHDSDVIRVTFLQRGGKNGRQVFRRVLNIDALLKRLTKIPNFKIKVVSYDFQEMSFLEQLKVTRNTDIFIGMHGAGLAHFLFLPDWAVAFELYNCGDVRCYRDLAALKGLHYITWEDESKLKDHDRGVHKQYGDHTKFWNFSFDVEEFIRLVRKARNLLLKNERFRHLRKQSKTENKTEL